MVADTSTQRQHESISLVRCPSERHIRQHRGVFFSANNRSQDRFPNLAPDVGENRAQFEIGIFQEFVDPIDQSGAFLGQGGAQAGQLAQVPLEPWGNEAGFEQAKLQELGDPFRIFFVRFMGRRPV
jgi:hypothetical protein